MTAHVPRPRAAEPPLVPDPEQPLPLRQRREPSSRPAGPPDPRGEQADLLARVRDALLVL